MEAKPKLETQNINLSFGSKHVLKDIGMQVPENSIVALIGPSGCGKSTLLRSMNRMHDLNPDAHVSGDIFLDGENIYGDDYDVVRVRRKIGMVFQRPNPFPKSIFNNIAYGLKINKLADKGQIPQIVEESLKGSYLWEEVKDSLDSSALSLSGGQQQRLCIARAIAIRPEVILMDEPTSALDPISTGKVEELMVELKKEFTIVIVTHSMQQARRISDYVGFMYLGDLAEYGATEQVFTDPQNELTEQYISGSFG